MTIEIQQPELEALILDWMRSGGFDNVEDALIQALRSSPLSPGRKFASQGRRSELTGAALVAAMQASPFKEIDLEPSRGRLPVRELPI
jgi:hypothetical protein